MNAGCDLLAEARCRGLDLQREGEHLRVRGPLDRDLRDRLVRQKAEVLAALAVEAARLKPYAWRLYSRLLGEDLWLVVDETDAADLEASLAREGDRRPVLTALELAGLAEMARADACAAARTILDVKRYIPGARLRPFGVEQYDA